VRLNTSFLFVLHFYYEKKSDSAHSYFKNLELEEKEEKRGKEEEEEETILKTCLKT
jgi:hypothetical protein